jgi:hypothetical protein
MIDQKNGYVKNNIMMNSNNTDLNSVNVVVGSQTTTSSLPKSKPVFNISWTIKKYFFIFVVLSIVLAISLIGMIIKYTTLKSELNRNGLNCFQEQMKNNETIRQLSIQTKSTEAEQSKRKIQCVFRVVA